MSDHRCPDSIMAMFDTDDEAKLSAGRLKAVSWYKGIMADVAIGDRILMPELGWMVKERTADQ